MKKIVKLYQYSMAYLQSDLREKVGLWPSPLVRVVSAESLAWGRNGNKDLNLDILDYLQ